MEHGRCILRDASWAYTLDWHRSIEFKKQYRQKASLIEAKSIKINQRYVDKNVEEGYCFKTEVVINYVKSFIRLPWKYRPVKT